MGMRWLERSFLVDRWQVLTSWLGLGSLVQALADYWFGFGSGSLEGEDCLLPWKG